MINLLYKIRVKMLKYFDSYNLDNYLNVFIEKYYKLTKTEKSGTRNRGKKRKVIVSLTTIPNRVEKVWLTIESLLRQTYKPDEIILWLAPEEFAGKELPEELKRQVQRGLRIRYCENLKSYKKFYYTAKENPSAYIVTVDDDMIYSEKMLETLVEEYKKNPGCIICHRSNLIKVRNGKLLPYNKWEMYEKREIIQKKPSYQNFFTSGGGTLIPIFKMDKCLLDKEVFMELAPNADDIWLNFVAWISGIKTKNVVGIFGHLIHISSSARNGLYRQNVLKNQNDVQIKKVMRHFDINILNYL